MIEGYQGERVARVCYCHQQLGMGAQRNAVRKLSVVVVVVVGTLLDPSHLTYTNYHIFSYTCVRIARWMLASPH